MTVDYTKSPAQKSVGGKSKSTGIEERICKRCYAIGKPRIIESGSWLGIILPMFFDLPTRIYGCRECNHPDSMVPLDSHEGQDAMHWRIKEKKTENDSAKSEF